jgi:hypothetical protein
MSSLLSAPLLALGLAVSAPIALWASVATGPTIPGPAILPSQPSARAALLYLGEVMDQYHDRFPVYDDVSSGSNHFFAWSKVPGARR